MTSFVKKTREKNVVGIVAFDLIGLLPTNHIIAYITIACVQTSPVSFVARCEETFDVNIRIAQTT